jgi:phage shock protein E
MVAGGALLLDVRTPEEFADGHIDGAVNISLADLDAAVPKLVKDRPVIVYCASGARAAVAAQHLTQAGFKVRDLGAMSNWNH